MVYHHLPLLLRRHKHRTITMIINFIIAVVLLLSLALLFTLDDTVTTTPSVVSAFRFAPIRTRRNFNTYDYNNQYITCSDRSMDPIDTIPSNNDTTARLHYTLQQHQFLHFCTNKIDTDSVVVVHSNRRSFLQQQQMRVVTAFVSTVAATTAIDIERVEAEIIDATDIFADNDWSSSSSAATTTSVIEGTKGSTGKQGDQYTPTDEVTVRINRKILQEKYDGRLGLELVNIEFRTNVRVRVKSVQEQSYASSQQIQPDWIVVSVNGKSMERTNAAGVRQYLIEAVQQQGSSTDNIVVVFRDPSIFQSQLRDMPSNPSTDEIPLTVTTQVGPSGDTTQRNKDGTVQSGRTVTTATTDQRITVQQLQRPGGGGTKQTFCTRSADVDDLLEISYTGTVVETGQLFDGSAILIDNNLGIPGRGNDISIFFVLGKQPLGQFPPGWDVGLLGMCVGERRRLIIPPTLAYGNKGLLRRNIPPNATLQYDITLISINGLATL